MKTILLISLGLLILRIIWKISKKLVKVFCGIVLIVMIVSGLSTRFQRDPDVVEWREKNYPGLTEGQVLSSLKDSTITVVNALTDIVSNVMSERCDELYQDLKDGLTK